MIELLSSKIKGKRVLLLGFGLEGQSTYKLLAETGLCRDIGIADINPPDSTCITNDLSEIKIHSGAGYLDCIDSYDIAFKSPGMVLPKDYKDYNCEITSQTEIFIQSHRNRIIGITGTKGKSTVATLLFHILAASSVPCILAGNIGKPVFDIIDDIQNETQIILELSCHQLEICCSSPAVSVLLNIFEDHLDHYGTFEKYIRAKKNIYLNQQSSDLLYCGEQALPFIEETVKPRIKVIKKDILPFTGFESIGDIALRGRHNLDNCAFAYSIAKTRGVSDKDFISALKTYKPLRHRLEFIGSRNGVDYYDDSISTTVESAISAVEGIKNASTILLGGMDRGIDYKPLADYIQKSDIKNVICMYQSGKRIFEMLKSCPPELTVTYCKELTEAVKTARKVTAPGKACILSPAAASYGDFKNFEERGDAYRKLLNL